MRYKIIPLLIIITLLLQFSLFGCGAGKTKSIETPEVGLIEELIPLPEEIFQETSYDINTSSLEEYTIKPKANEINDLEWANYINKVESIDYAYWKLADRPNDMSRIYISSNSKYKLEIMRYGQNNFAGYITVSINKEEENYEE